MNKYQKIELKHAATDFATALDAFVMTVIRVIGFCAVLLFAAAVFFENDEIFALVSEVLK